MTRGSGADAAAVAIARGEHGDPFSWLGMHRDGDAVVVRVLRPGATSVHVLDAKTRKVLVELARVLDEGVFVGRIRRHREPFPYRLRVQVGGETFEEDDPYRFPPVLGEIDVHLLAEGNHLRLYERLGAHPTTLEGVAGVSFAVWAPNASRVAVIGDFNQWDGRRHAMRRRVECGVWEIFLPGVQLGARYKFQVRGPGGAHLPDKADPLAFAMEPPPSTASIVVAQQARGPSTAAEEGSRIAARDRLNALDAPISIYEVHLGSWARVPEEGDRFLTWRELAERLVPYARDMGFTHLELLPISEHPFYASWGYQPLGLFAPTARHGDAAGFTAFVAACHAAGLGVLIDWVPAHFPTDPHGLARFDGTHLYEHADPRQGLHRDWNTLIYNFGRSEVRNFLLANALYWFDRHGVDGLRVDAVASMLYLDYSREPGEWVPNAHGGRENLEAVHFVRRLNELVFGEYPGTSTFAEESTAWPMVSRPTYLGGLGFGFKWNMGWMHDTLAYMSKDPVFRSHHHDHLTFGLLYAFSENFVLPLSHDEVVHGKGSLLGKMPGDDWQRFANLRAYLAFMWTHPGKKLLFMGGEFGQRREWDHDTSLDWHLLEDPRHRGVQTLVRTLNALYRTLPALHAGDCRPDGFEWVDANDRDNSVICYLRRGPAAHDLALVVCNFTPVLRHGYRVGVPYGGFWRERLNTDAGELGGSGAGNLGGLYAEGLPHHGRPCSLPLTLPPLATLVLTPEAPAGSGGGRE